MFNPLGPWNAWFALSTQAARMCWDAQAVILLRCLRVAQGGAKARAETQRMITEKAAALVEAQVAATAAKLKRKRKNQVAKKAVAHYARRVRRNRRRLAKSRSRHGCPRVFTVAGPATQSLRGTGCASGADQSPKWPCS